MCLGKMLLHPSRDGMLIKTCVVASSFELRATFCVVNACEICWGRVNLGNPNDDGGGRCVEIVDQFRSDEKRVKKEASGVLCVSESTMHTKGQRPGAVECGQTFVNSFASLHDRCRCESIQK